MDIKIRDVHGFEWAMRGMRAPLKTYNRNDTTGELVGCGDLKTACNLSKGGAEERKFMRFIHVVLEINAPTFWWTQFDTYKFADSNSESKMHKWTEKPLTADDFQHTILPYTLDELNRLRLAYLDTKDKHLKEAYMQRWLNELPQGYLQRRFITLSYETLFTIYFQRHYHKLSQWRYFCEVIKKLPYMNSFIEAHEKTGV